MKTGYKLGALIGSNILGIILWSFVIAQLGVLHPYSVFAIISIIFLIYSSFFAWNLKTGTVEALKNKQIKIAILAALSSGPNLLSSLLYLAIIADLSSSKIILKSKSKQISFGEGILIIILSLVITGAITSLIYFDSFAHIRSFVFAMMAAIMLGAAIILERKKKKKAALAYNVMGMLFTFITYLSFGYIERFGTWFSFYGEGKLLFLSSSFIFLAILIAVNYLNYKKESLIFIFYSVLVLAAINFLRFFALGVEEIFLIILPVFLFLSFINKKTKTSKNNVLLDFTTVLTICFAFIFFIYSFKMVNTLAVYSLSVLFVAFFHLLVKRTKLNDLKPFLSIISYLMFFPSLIVMRNSGAGLAFATALFAITVYFLSYFFKEKEVKIGSIVTTNALLFLSFILAITTSSLTALIIAEMAILLGCLITLLESEKSPSTYLELYLSPVKIGMLAFALALHFNYTSNMWQAFVFFNLIANVLIYLLTKSKEMKSLYRKSSFVGLLIAVVSIKSFTSLTMSIATLASILLFYAEYNWNDKGNKSFQNLIYLLMLFSTYIVILNIDSFIHYYNYFNTDYFYANVITVIVFLTIALFHYKEKTKASLALILATIPFLALLNNVVSAPIIKISQSLIVLYLGLIATRFTEHNLIKDFIKYFVYLVAYLLVIFNTSIITLIYILILSLVLYLRSKYKKDPVIFKISVIGLFSSLIYRFAVLLSKGPIRLYLIILVLILIILLFSRQLSYDKKLKDK